MSDAVIKRLFVVCLLAAVPGQLAAQAVPANPAAAKAPEPLGRLFFTPAQRASLDIARVQRARGTLSTEKTEEAAPVAQSITYGGIVRRSDGKTTLWLNNRPVDGQEPLGGITIVGRIGADGSVSLQVPQSGRSVNLKPGQSVELLSGTIEEAYSRRSTPAAEPKSTAKPAADAKSAKPEPDRARDERDREDQQRKLEDAARALQEAASAKPGAAPVAPQPEAPRR